MLCNELIVQVDASVGSNGDATRKRRRLFDGICPTLSSESPLLFSGTDESTDEANVAEATASVDADTPTEADAANTLIAQLKANRMPVGTALDWELIPPCTSHVAATHRCHHHPLAALFVKYHSLMRSTAVCGPQEIASQPIQLSSSTALVY